MDICKLWVKAFFAVKEICLFLMANPFKHVITHYATTTLSPQHQLYSVKYLYRCVCKYVCISIPLSVPMNCIYTSVLLLLNL